MAEIYQAYSAAVGKRVAITIGIKHKLKENEQVSVTISDKTSPKQWIAALRKIAQDVEKACG